MKIDFSYKGPVIGDRRTRKGFLFFPKIINEIFKWLETAEWEEEYQEVDNKNSDMFEGSTYSEKWVGVRWR
jgi:hypothetical protein